MPDGCAGASKSTPWTFADDFSEMRQVGALFGVRGRAERVIAAQKATLKKAVGRSLPGKGVRILWWDSSTQSPYVGACCGGPSLIMRTVGATNVFADAEGNWTDVDWETAIARNPDVIVIVDASWDTAASKRRFLATDEALRALPAVQRKRFVAIPFSDSTPGVRNVDGVRLLAAGLRKLHLEK
jgi:iron complex transport system substrate-binding protein